MVGLARDGCLVRSWVGGHAVGLAVERKRGPARAVLYGNLLQKQLPTTPPAWPFN